MSVITYYFNAYDTGVTEWETNPENMVDGDTGVYADTTINDDLQLLTGNTCAGSDIGTITKVEIRAFNYIANVSRVYLTPVFGGTDDGDTENTNAGFSGAWSSYFDITEDTNAPGTWGWSDVQNLDCKVAATYDAGTLHVSKVEIRVTYTPAFTSKATGNWDSEGESTWNEPGHPDSSSTVTIQSGHTITLDSPASCNKLIIDSGGILTDATNNQGLTVTLWTDVSGTLTCGSAAMSFGSGRTELLAQLEIKAGGVFNGGSGAHTIGSLESITATSTLTMTSGNCTINGSQSGTQFEISSDSTFNHNDGTIVLAYGHHLFVDTQSLYNLTINHAAGDTHLDADLTIANDLIITAGGFETDDDGGPSYDVAVGGDVEINGGNMECKASTTINFDGDVTIGAGATLEAPTGTLYFSGDTWTNEGTFTHKDGTVNFDGSNQEIVGSNTWYNFTKAITTARTLTVDNTSTQTFEKNLTLNGISEQLLSILSDSAGSAFDFVMTSDAVKTKLEYLSVKDSDASSSDASHKPIEPTDSVDVSGNTDWFSATAVSNEFTTSRSYYY